MVSRNVKEYCKQSGMNFPRSQCQTLFRTMAYIPSLTSSSNNDGHSCRNMWAPVKLPSPPIHTRLVMPVCTRVSAAFRRPSRVMKSVHRALPITVPPYKTMKCRSWSRLQLLIKLQSIKQPKTTKETYIPQ